MQVVTLCVPSNEKEKLKTSNQWDETEFRKARPSPCSTLAAPTSVRSDAKRSKSEMDIHLSHWDEGCRCRGVICPYGHCNRLLHWHACGRNQAEAAHDGAGDGGLVLEHLIALVAIFLLYALPIEKCWNLTSNCS